MRSMHLLNRPVAKSPAGIAGWRSSLLRVAVLLSVTLLLAMLPAQSASPAEGPGGISSGVWQYVDDQGNGTTATWTIESSVSVTELALGSIEAVPFTVRTTWTYQYSLPCGQTPGSDGYDRWPDDPLMSTSWAVWPTEPDDPPWQNGTVNLPGSSQETDGTFQTTTSSCGVTNVEVTEQSGVLRGLGAVQAPGCFTPAVWNVAQNSGAPRGYVGGTFATVSVGGAQCGIETDSDSDGIPDSQDQCPETPIGTPVDNRGCPSADSDGDGVQDFLDACPDTPAGVAVDASGCPLPPDDCPGPDTDMDGIADSCDLDDDNDRLPDDYEAALQTDPLHADSDQDGYHDNVEVATGSDPNNPAETPENLPSGQFASGGVALTGDVGITCGATQFDWHHVTGEPIGVPRGEKGCLLLLSNDFANKVIEIALKHGPDVTGVLLNLVGPYLLEQYGQEAVDWAAEFIVDQSVNWVERELKSALLRALNLARINAIFTAGKVVGLAAVPIGAGFAINEIVENRACIGVRLGSTPDDKMSLTWHLVYSDHRVPDDPELSYVAVYRKIPKPFALDTVRRETANLSCNDGAVSATGAASNVFRKPITAVF